MLLTILVRTFLGYTMNANKQPRLRIAATSERLRSKLRTTLRQGRGCTLPSAVKP
ncbi:hypothetical protein [Bradyrhizobium sp. 142]|uniref:hypothetical protein n=1 Tax=Bradyrhizobium sp. 142 TaxID=2782618 RepID=UPI001FF8760B|nr:hypothetical protein [Bradyrhizobium sp. 142]MCK1726373.1 hypothetical protein [Bradyrhizobium sp. 142]